MMPVFARRQSTMNTRILATDCADYTEKTMTESNLLHHELTRKILRAFFQVHSDLGEGFLGAKAKESRRDVGSRPLRRSAFLRELREIRSHLLVSAMK
jgi:hypothetical protein